MVRCLNLLLQTKLQQAIQDLSPNGPVYVHIVCSANTLWRQARLKNVPQNATTGALVQGNAASARSGLFDNAALGAEFRPDYIILMLQMIPFQFPHLAFSGFMRGFKWSCGNGCVGSFMRLATLYPALDYQYTVCQQRWLTAPSVCPLGIVNTQECRGNPPALDKSPYMEIHDVGGNPPTLDSPLLRGDQFSYTTDEDLVGGPRRSQELLANFSQVVSREVPLVPKESMIGRIVGMPFIPKGCEFDSARVICDLGKMVVTRQSLSIDGGTLRQADAYRSMHRVGNHPLSVVVVHLYLVKLLKEGKVILKESDEILFDRFGKGVYACIFALSIAQREIVEGHLLNQNVESDQITFAHLNVEVFVLFVSVKDRGEMECLFWKVGAVQRLLVFADAFGDILGLIVEYEGDPIVLGAVTNVTRFVYEDGKLSRQAAPSVIKMPRDTPRLRDSPPYVESYLSYTTSRSAESIVRETEHRFVTIYANTCSTYRRAA